MSRWNLGNRCGGGLYPPESNQPFSEHFPRERVTCPNETEDRECSDEGRLCDVCREREMPRRCTHAEFLAAHERYFENRSRRLATHRDGWPPDKGF